MTHAEMMASARSSRGRVSFGTFFHDVILKASNWDLSHFRQTREPLMELL